MSYSFDERYAIYSEREHAARKPHACDACGATVQPGTKYTAIFLLFGAAHENIKRCARCQALHEHLRGLAPGDMWPKEKLDCGQDYEEEWGPVPPHIAALAFWLSGDPLPSEESA